MANYIIYPNPAFQPRTDHLPDGTPVAYDAQTDLWATRSGLIYRREPDGTWTRKHLIGCTPIVPTPNRHSQYPLVRVDGHRSPVTVHSVVARAWIGDRPPIRDTYSNILGYMEIDHLNGNILDCRVSNLQWVTHAENMRRAGLMRCMRKIGLAPLWLYPGILRSLYSLPTEQAELIIERFRAQTTITDDPLTIPNINATLAFLLDELKENITNGQWPKQGPRRALT